METTSVLRYFSPSGKGPRNLNHFLHLEARFIWNRYVKSNLSHNMWSDYCWCTVTLLLLYYSNQRILLVCLVSQKMKYIFSVAILLSVCIYIYIYIERERECDEEEREKSFDSVDKESMTLGDSPIRSSDEDVDCIGEKLAVTKHRWFCVYAIEI